MRIATLLLLLALSSPAFSAPGPDESPARPGEWGFRPADGARCEVDPPAFTWRPQKKAKSYEIYVRRQDAIEPPVYRAKGLRLPAHRPHRALGPGHYLWRFRVEGGAYSTERTFTIVEDATAFPLPAREELLGRIPEGHPRIFFGKGDLPRLQALAKGRLAGAWKMIARKCEKMLAKPIDATEPLTYRVNEIRGVNDDAWRKRWWGNRKRVIEVVDGAATLGFAWRISGDERFAKEGRRLLLAAAGWNPKGATGYRYNDEAGMPFAWAGARAYSWLHDVLSEEDRARVREMMRVRMGEMSRHLIGRHHLWRPYGSHANRAWHWLGEVGCAFHGEIPGADHAVWFAMTTFHCAYPVWSDDDGGWHEGIAYWNSYLGRAMTWMLQMREVLGHDGFRKPCFAKAGDFAAYVVPPGETMGGFGDLTLGYTAKRCRPLMSILAKMTGNPHWRRHVERTEGRSNRGGYLGFLFEALPDAEARDDGPRPDSVVFRGTGVAVLHRDLENRENDVQFMLKSSPMGAQSHGYESQNAFLLSVAGEPIFIRSGRRDLYGSPHHRKWMWSTRSVNSVLVNGLGQAARTAGPLGRISRVEWRREFDHVEGEAAPAYVGRLERFTRAVLFLRPDWIVMLDALEAKKPSTFQWLLHSPNEMDVAGSTIRAVGSKAGAEVRILAPSDLEITQTDRFDPPPQPWVKLRQWHLTAGTRVKSRTAEFVTLIRPHRLDEPLPAVETKILRSENAVGLEIVAPTRRAWVTWRLRGTSEVRLGPIETKVRTSAVVTDEKGRVLRAYRETRAAPVRFQGEEIPRALFGKRG